MRLSDPGSTRALYAMVYLFTMNKKMRSMHASCLCFLTFQHRFRLVHVRCAAECLVDSSGGIRARARCSKHTEHAPHTHQAHSMSVCVCVCRFVPCFVRNTRINELNTQTSLSSHIVYADRTRAEHQLACATNKILAILAYRI